MQVNNVTSLRQMLEQMTTEQLRESLQAELAQEQPEQQSIQMLLSMLESRYPQKLPEDLTAQERKLWEQYRKRQAKLAAPRKTVPRWWAAVCAAVVVLALVILGYRGPERGLENYRFQTDNPGLAQVYDAVVELGVESPVVPMWLPEEYGLVEIKQLDTTKLIGIMACFSDGTNAFVMKNVVFDEEVSREFYIDNPQKEIFRYMGVDHQITRNQNRWVVVWSTEDNIECFFTVECSEEVLHRIIRSIYTKEDAQ